MYVTVEGVSGKKLEESKGKKKKGTSIVQVNGISQTYVL